MPVGVDSMARKDVEVHWGFIYVFYFPKPKVKKMRCTACHESCYLVLTGGTNATDVSSEGTMCILRCLRDFPLTQHTDMHMYIKLKLLATSWYTLCTYLLSYLINS